MDAETKRIREEKRKEAKLYVKEHDGIFFCQWKGCKSPEIGEWRNVSLSCNLSS